MNYVYDDYEFMGRDECVIPYCSQDAIYETADGPMCGGCASRSLKEDDDA